MCFLSSGSLPTYQQPYPAYQHPSWARDTCGNIQSHGASPNPGSGRNRNFDPLACDGRLCPYWARIKLLLPLSTIMAEILAFYQKFQSHSKFYSVFPKKVQPQLWQVSCPACWQFACMECEHLGFCPKGSWAPAITRVFYLLSFRLHRHILVFPLSTNRHFFAFLYSLLKPCRNFERMFSFGNWLKQNIQQECVWKYVFLTHTHTKMSSKSNSFQQVRCDVHNFWC